MFLSDGYGWNMREGWGRIWGIIDWGKGSGGRTIRENFKRVRVSEMFCEGVYGNVFPVSFSITGAVITFSGG